MTEIEAPQVKEPEQPEVKPVVKKKKEQPISHEEELDSLEHVNIIFIGHVGTFVMLTISICSQVEFTART